MSEENKRPPFDTVIRQIAEYAASPLQASDLAQETARWMLLDSVACALMALSFDKCTRLLGPVVPGAVLANGARVIGSAEQYDPVRAAFNNGALIRWLDYNDTWLAAEWGHPSDNLGGILAITDYLCRQSCAAGGPPLPLARVLEAAIKAHEIQGVLALTNSFNRQGFDHVALVKIASTAVVSHLLGGDVDTICRALSLAIVDGQSLRTYRHAPNTGSRKSWAAGDATSRAVWLALMAQRGEMGYPSALTAPRWGFEAVLFDGKPLELSRPLGCYVMENVLFKISFPAEFHAQTAVEAAIQLHPEVKNRLNEIDYIDVKTQESAIRIIDKQGPLYNPADRDHCLQYMIAIGLLYGSLTAEHYEDKIAKNPDIDLLRSKMRVSEDPRYSREYLEAGKRAIGNGIQVFFKDGSHTNLVSIDYPVGHRRRRQEGLPLLQQKFEHAVKAHYPAGQAQKIQALTKAIDQLDNMSVKAFMDLWVLSDQGI